MHFIQLLLNSLVTDFASCLEYAQRTALSGYDQYIATVESRKRFANVQDAISNDDFLRSLHDTLRGFFRLRRGKTPLVPLDQFKHELTKHSQSISAFERSKLGTLSIEHSAELWTLINQLRLTIEIEKTTKKPNPKVVSGTKALHLLLPELVVPIDRQYTGAFFFRYSTDFGAGLAEHETFRVAFDVFQTIAKGVSLERYVGTHRIHTTTTKVIDNAVIGFVERAREEFQKHALMQCASKQSAP